MAWSWAPQKKQKKPNTHSKLHPIDFDHKRGSTWFWMPDIFRFIDFHCRMLLFFSSENAGLLPILQQNEPVPTLFAKISKMSIIASNNRTFKCNFFICKVFLWNQKWSGEVTKCAIFSENCNFLTNSPG